MGAIAGFTGMGADEASVGQLAVVILPIAAIVMLVRRWLVPWYVRRHPQLFAG